MNSLKEDAGTDISYESAEASLILRIHRFFAKRGYMPFFTLTQMRVVSEHPAPGQESTAIVNLRVGENDTLSAGQGAGPVHALDDALIKSLKPFYPGVKQIRLTDYKVRVLNPAAATAARVRVLITSTDGQSVWTTVGVSDNIVRASWDALSDAVEYYLMEKGKEV
jgi:2-isopropylmalate synthase